MDQQARLRSFQELTGCNDSESRRYLDQHDWDVELAASIYFSEKTANKPAPTAKPASKQTSASSKRGVTGFSDIQSSQQDDDNDVKWFTGGEKSGLQVQAPKQQDSSNLVQAIMQNAKQRGARSIEEDSEPSSFSGYRLGNTPGSGIPASSTAPREVRTKITMWKNGFCVDNGSLRDYNDPANSSFLSAIRSGVVPKELQVGPGVKDVSVELIDKRGEDFKEPPQVMKPFTGSGYALSNQKSTQPSSSTAPQPVHEVTVDESQPTTTIQIRLSNGTRLVAKFNHFHTIKDIKAYINKHQQQKINYDLATNFPQKVLEDHQTIQDAGILNSVLLQKPK